MSLKAIQEALGSKTDQFPVGTTLRWKSGQYYMYWAGKTQNGWYHTGSHNSEWLIPRNPISFEDLLDVLTDDRTSDIEIATHWEAVEAAQVEDQPQAKRAPKRIPRENFSRDPEDEAFDPSEEQDDVGFGGNGEHV